MSTATFRPEDVVIGILAEVSRKKGDRFEANPVQMHPAFHEWRDKSEFRELLGQFIFDGRDYFPYSETLENVLDSLQFAGYLERTNPRGTYYQITPALVSLYDSETKPKFSGPQANAIATIADLFCDAVKTKRTGVAV